MFCSLPTVTLTGGPKTPSCQAHDLLQLTAAKGFIVKMAGGNGSAGHSGSPPKGCLEHLSHAVESKMFGFFSRLGRFVGEHPYRTLLAAIIVVVIGASGISVLENESRGDKLWLPTDTRAQTDWVSAPNTLP